MEPTIKLTGFELIEMLGKGGIGVVWKARQLSLDRIVAIKLLLPEFNRDKDENRRLVLEARTAAKLKHSGIVQVYDASEENGVFFFVMEYVAGYSVGTWLRRKHKLLEGDTITVGLAVADALDYAWRTTKLIHCDIKPDNIMVDTDGAIKVADLGLSRTFDTHAAAQDDDVLGTPSYMSPEQVEGLADLDCRTDIYALGATMYQMVTDHRPFQEVPDRKAADLQISGYLPDAIDLNPSLTPAFCAVLEKMLAKNRDNRYTSWSEVISDLRLVLAHKAHQTPLLAPGASTMQRSRKRSAAPIRVAAKIWKWMLMGGLIAVVLLSIRLLAKPLRNLAKAISNPAMSTSAVPASPPSTPSPPLIDVRQRTPDVAARAPAVPADIVAYGKWQTWSRSNSNDYDGSIERLTGIVRQHPGSEGAAKAVQALDATVKQRDDAMRLAWERLEAEAGALAKKQQTVEAARLLTSYDGPFAAALLTKRTALAGTYRDSADKSQDAQQTLNDQKLLNRLGAFLSTGACVAAHTEIAERLAGMPVPDGNFRDTLTRINAVIAAAADVEVRVLSTFAAQAGQLVTVEMGRGSQHLRIMAVEDRRVRAQTTGVEAEIGFGVADLSADERERRLSLLNDDAAWLRRGAAAVNANNLDAARVAFEKIGPPLGLLLTGQVDAQNKLRTEAQAQAAWHAILEEVGLISGAGGDDAVTPAAAGRLPVSLGVAGKTMKRLQAFREQFGSSLVALRAAPVFNVLERECKRMLQNVDDRGSAPAAGQGMRGAELKRALLDANPDLDQYAVKYEEQNGRVVTLRVCSDSLRDLSPLTHAESLRAVSLEPLERNMLVLDVKALMHLPELVNLRLSRVSITDPTVLSELKLQELTVERGGLQDLQWAKKMPLRCLNVSGNRIKDFTPLRHMEGLEKIELEDTGLIVLDGVPLRSLRELKVSRTSVRDLGMLRAAPLEHLDMIGLKIGDWSWLRGLALTYLDVSDSNFRDSALLNRMPLRVLKMRNTGVGDLSALNGLPLVELDLSGTALQDLAQLRDLRLENLSLARTRVTSGALGNLAGMPLRRLDLSGTAVADLRSLKDLPLVQLDLTGTRVKDLTPLNGMSIESLWLTVDDQQNPLRGLRTILRGLPALKEVNGKRVNAILRGE